MAAMLIAIGLPLICVCQFIILWEQDRQRGNFDTMLTLLSRYADALDLGPPDDAQTDTP